MEKERYKVIVNPSGEGKAAERIPEIEGYLRECKLNFEIQVTRMSGMQRNSLREAAERVLLSRLRRGHGTANEVKNGLCLQGHGATGCLHLSLEHRSETTFPTGR